MRISIKNSILFRQLHFHHRQLSRMLFRPLLNLRLQKLNPSLSLMKLKLYFISPSRHIRYIQTMHRFRRLKISYYLLKPLNLVLLWRCLNWNVRTPSPFLILLQLQLGLLRISHLVHPFFHHPLQFFNHLLLFPYRILINVYPLHIFFCFFKLLS